MKHKGELIEISGHNVHVYRIGDSNKPKIVLMSGSGTIAPVFDFKILYDRLINYFRVIVIEKFGYGYSDICDYPCDIDTIVSIQKQALDAIGEKGPYILMPHSMAGIEALRWKQLYPDNISAIIGIDMCTPLTYSIWTKEKVDKKVQLMKFVTKYHLSGLLCPINNRNLDKDEIRQHKLLRKRNVFNICIINEAKKILDNVDIVRRNGYPECPTLLFCANKNASPEYWKKCQEKFALIMNANLVAYDCGHYIHHYKSAKMSTEIVSFIEALGR